MAAYRTSGFTFAELMMALLILAVVSTFTIPKVLSSEQVNRYKATAKETAGMITAAYQAYQMTGQAGTGTKSTDLTPYMNYIRMATSGAVDQVQTGGSINCTSSTPCLVLHNGGRLRYSITTSFGGSASTNALWFQFDPDGKVTDGTTNGPGKSVEFDMYYNSRITTWGTCASGTTDSGGVPWNPLSDHDPPWFGWD